MIALGANPTQLGYKGTQLYPYPNPDPGNPALFPGQKVASWDAPLGAWKYLDIDNGFPRVTPDGGSGGWAFNTYNWYTSIS